VNGHYTNAVSYGMLGGMKFPFMLWGVTATLGVLLLVPVVGATPTPSTPVVGTGWPVYGGDAGNTRYSSAAQITTANVGTLRLAWSFHTGVKGITPKRRGHTGAAATGKGGEI